MRDVDASPLFHCEEQLSDDKDTSYVAGSSKKHLPVRLGDVAEMQVGSNKVLHGPCCGIASLLDPQASHSTVEQHGSGQLAAADSWDPGLGMKPCVNMWDGGRCSLLARTYIRWWKVFPISAGVVGFIAKEWADKSWIQAFAASSDGNCAGKELKCASQEVASAPKDGHRTREERAIQSVLGLL